MYASDYWNLVEPGDEVVAGLCAGDEIQDETYGRGWVSNIVTGEPGEIIHTKVDPTTWKHGEPAHGNYSRYSDVKVVIQKWTVTDEEVAEVFGIKKVVA